MELNLSRVDYLHGGSSFPNCIKILPTFSEDKAQHRLVVANREGNVQVVGWGKSEVITICRFNLGTLISALSLGGAVGTAKDKIFLASGNMIRGFTKKGKLFLEFDTNLAESIQNMFVTGSHLLVCGKNVYNQYEDCQDTGFYVSDDEITAVLALQVDKVGKLVPVISCRDRTLKVMDKAKVRYLFHLDGIPTALGLFNGDGGDIGSDVLVGSSDGCLCLVSIGDESAILRWTHDTETSAGVTCVDFYDVTANGGKELLVGFDDGTVQVYGIDGDDYQLVPPRLLFSQTCNESVTGITGGIFGADNFEEVLVVTYSGWVYGLTTETIDKKIRVDDGTFSISVDTRQKLEKLRTEIDDLQERVIQERDKYQTATQTASSGFSVVPFFKVNDKMVLNREDASYLLTIEVESPIDTILIQSDVPIDLLDVERNSAVVSYSECEPDSGNFLLVTFRCQANTTRIEVRLRTIEGQHGTVRAYVTPRILPKCCQVRTFSVKSLSLHVRSHGFDVNRPYNTLKINGTFSAVEMHSWLSNCIPEMPARAPSSGEAAITFLSTFFDTILHCTFSKGTAEFKSDNVSTISILKDWITKEATNKKINLDIDCEFNDESVLHTLQLIRPKLDGYLSLTKQVALIEALKEIQAHDPDFEKILSSEYKYILNNADKLKAMHKRQPNYLDRLFGMITDLYIDKHKYNGINVKSRVPQLMEVLDKQNFDALVDFFQAPIYETRGSYI
ncbi:Bardet-Biedl syndrome 7 protein homolog [Folsomia candida]|uniref:Bardet-Biedl syndrome 7 protein homolog n=1 Tax=Folsomia candida TaxID=158441 RepID=UPI0016053C6C|nr:Bardet-Biedl syndrome 7 protein homolog [Folsomia candida]